MFILLHIHRRDRRSNPYYSIAIDTRPSWLLTLAIVSLSPWYRYRHRHCDAIWFYAAIPGLRPPFKELRHSACHHRPFYKSASLWPSNSSTSPNASPSLLTISRSSAFTRLTLLLANHTQHSAQKIANANGRRMQQPAGFSRWHLLNIHFTLFWADIHLQMSSTIGKDLICIKTLKEEGNNYVHHTQNEAAFNENTTINHKGLV